MTSTFSIPMRRSSLATKSAAFCTSDLCSVKGADAGNAKQIFEFIQESLLILASIIDRGRSHKCVPFRGTISD